MSSNVGDIVLKLGGGGVKEIFKTLIGCEG